MAEYEEVMTKIAKTYDVPSFLAGMHYTANLIKAVGDDSKKNIREHLTESAGDRADLPPETLSYVLKASDHLFSVFVLTQKGEIDKLLKMASEKLYQYKAGCTDAHLNRLVDALKK